ncbi:MAG: MarR family winged helix-turn-helix transcriptional regulator [Acidimicrobiia bacterium]
MTTKISPTLVGDELNIWNSYLLATRLLFDRLDDRLGEDAGVSLADFIVLFRLGGAGPNGMRMSELADSAVFSRSRISHAFRRLEGEGWVERRSCPTDRRGSFGFLTEAGRRKLEEAESTHNEVVRRYFLDSIGEGQAEPFRVFTNTMLRALGGHPDVEPC